MAPDLFSPVALGALTLPNRVVMAPMTRSRADGTLAAPLAATYYAQRASAGLIVSEGTQVSTQGVGYVNTPGIYSDDHAAAWRPVTEAVHAAGGRIFAQLWHVGRVSHAYFHGGALPVGPSAIAGVGNVFTPNGFEPMPTPRALETDEVAGIVEDFARAARYAREAGFDGVEVHGANGYLIEQFLFSGSNTRTDGYGGSAENRARFLYEILDAVTAAWSADRVGLRLSPRNTFNGGVEDDRAGLADVLARGLSGRGLAYVHLVDPYEGERLAPAFRAAYDGALIVAGGYTGETARAVVAAGEADAVAFATAFISNPDLVERLRVGAPLADADQATFYGGTEKGYTDYPALAEADALAA